MAGENETIDITGFALILQNDFKSLSVQSGGKDGATRKFAGSSQKVA